MIVCVVHQTKLIVVVLCVHCITQCAVYSAQCAVCITQCAVCRLTVVVLCLREKV